MASSAEQSHRGADVARGKGHECRSSESDRDWSIWVPLTTDLHELLIRSVVEYAICMLDPDGYVVSWNPGAERVKGYSAQEIIGQHFSRFYTEEDRAAGSPSAAL